MAHKGALTARHVEQRYAIRMRFVLPSDGYGARLTEMTRWLESTAGRGGYRIWPSLHAPVWPDTMSVFLDDPKIALALVERFGLEPAPDMRVNVAR